jgi:hypothetical protein
MIGGGGFSRSPGQSIPSVRCRLMLRRSADARRAAPDRATPRRADPRRSPILAVWATMRPGRGLSRTTSKLPLKVVVIVNPSPARKQRVGSPGGNGRGGVYRGVEDLAGGLFWDGPRFHPGAAVARRLLSRVTSRPMSCRAASDHVLPCPADGLRDRGDVPMTARREGECLT